MGVCRIVLSSVVLLSLATTSHAHARRGGCYSSSGGNCYSSDCVAQDCQQEPRYVEKTIYVPTWVTENRTVRYTEYRRETREKEVTVYKCVPETREVTREYTVMVPETRTKTVNYKVCKPVYETVSQDYQVRVPVWRNVERSYDVRVPVYTDVEKTYTVMVPHREERQGTRTVCRIVPEKQTRTVKRDRGHWETQTYEVPVNCCRSGRRCGGCSSCGGCGSDCGPTTRQVCKRVWVPNVVTEEIEVTVCRRVTEEVPYTYSVTVCKPETRTRTVRQCSYKTETRTCTDRVCDYKTETRTRTYKVCKPVYETRSREVEYTVCVPQTRTKTYNVTDYKRVPEQQTRTYTVCVPHEVEKQVQVRVCKRVPKTVQVRVDCGGCYSGRRGGRCCN